MLACTVQEEIGLIGAFTLIAHDRVDARLLLRLVSLVICQALASKVVQCASAPGRCWSTRLRWSTTTMHSPRRSNTPRTVHDRGKARREDHVSSGRLMKYHASS